MLEAKDIMTKDVYAVNAETSVYEAMNILINKKVSGLPVVDKKNNLVGIITEKDMLRLLLFRSISEKKTVADYMTRRVISFAPEDSVVTLAEFFIENPFRRVTIVRDKKLLGVVSRRDIIKMILKIKAESGKQTETSSNE